MMDMRHLDNLMFFFSCCTCRVEMNYMFINALCLKLLLTCKCVYITENFLVSWLYAVLLYFLLFLTFYLIEEGKIKKPEAANISFAQPFNFLSMFVYCHLYFICNLWIYWTAIIFRNIKVFFLIWLTLESETLSTIV